MNALLETTRSFSMLDIANLRRAVWPALFLLAATAGPAHLALAVVPNQPICTAALSQMAPSSVPNGAGGSLVTWADFRSGDLDVYAQQTNTLGEPLWSADGIPICKAAGFQQFPRIVSDGTGGAIIVWQDQRGADQDIYAQRVTGSGTIVWTSGGVPVCTATGVQEFPQIVADGTGGALIVWVDRRGANADIYVQRLDAGGNPAWAANGVGLCTAAGDQTDPTLSSDTWGGAIALWKDARLGPSDLYAQRVNASGVPQWTANGMAVCLATDEQQTPVGIPDGAGGLLATWSDHRSGNWDVYAQRLNGSGAPSWALNGVGLCAATGDQTSPKLCTDGAGGAIVAWEDRRGANADIYAQRINSTGSLLWALNGASVCTATADQVTPAIFTDLAGGALVVWSDARTSANGTDIYAQRVDSAAGAPAWTANGVVLCDTLGNQEAPAVVCDGENGALAVWRDLRPGNNTSDLYAQHVDAGGLVQGQCPASESTLTANSLATAVSKYVYYNVPVPITFYWSGVGVRSPAGSDWDIDFYDQFGYGLGPYPVCFGYPLAASNNGGMVDFVVASFETNRTPSNGDYGARVSRFSGSGNGTVEWDLTAKTIVKDCTGSCGAVSGSNWTGVLDVYDVKLDAGLTYTFDFTHTGSADIKLLLFTSNGQTGPYVVSRDHAVFETVNRYTTYTAPATEFYGVVLVNDNGLAGTYQAKVITGIPVGVGDTPVAKSTMMGVAPNPAHGEASFRFSLREAGEVSFRVMDMAGRLVGSIPSQRWQPGTWTVRWDGRGSDGRSVAAGVYFVQMELDGRPLGQQRLALVR